MNTLFRYAVPFAFVTLLPAFAAASPEFVVEIEELAGMQCTPRCTICHTTNPGRASTATQPFANSLLEAVDPEPEVAADLLAGDVDVLRAAYEDIGDADSDGDGVGDKVELGTPAGDPNDPESEYVAAQDPSVSGAGDACELVEYGCGAHVARAPESSTGAWMSVGAVLVLVTLTLRRRASS